MFRGKSIFFLACLLLISKFSLAQIFAVQDGLWSSPATWSQPNIPAFDDEVTIDGFAVFLDQDATVESLMITNTSGSNNAKLDMNGTGVVLTITTDLNVINDSDQDTDTDFYIRDLDSVYVGGMVNFSRAAARTTSGSCNMKLAGDSRLTVDKDYNYNYGNSGLAEAGLELQLLNNSVVSIGGNLTMTSVDGNGIGVIVEDNAELNVEGNTSLINISGLGMLFNVKEFATANLSGNLTIDNQKTSGFNAFNFVQVGNGGGTMIVGGHLNLKSIKDDQRSKILVNGISASLEVKGDVNYSSVGDQDLIVAIEAGATFYLGGSLNRSLGVFGDLDMEADTKIIYNGKGAQSIPESTADGAGTDVFQFATVEFNNDSGQPLILNGPMVIEKELQLTKGILQSSTNAEVIISEDAIVTGGSVSSYVDGPVIKEGAISGDSFTFPLGDMGVYAPLEISVPKSGATIEYKAQFLSCPPPLSGSLGSSLTTVSGTAHWVFNRSATSPEADITLHWGDAAAYGITDTADLRVAVYHPDSSAWVSIGKSDLQLNGDNSGSIRNGLSCPPPLSGSLYTFGSEKGLNALPVVLSGFQALTRGQVVEISWETASEFNSDFFEIERSTNGLHFQPIQKVKSLRNGNQLTRYFEKDINPNKGTNYYRLCQVDNMGMKVYSRIVSANFTSFEKVSVFPNPVKDILHIKGDFETKVYDLEVFDPAGKPLHQTSILGEKGILQLNTDEMNLPGTGIYFIRINKDDWQQTIPFIKD